MNYLRHLAFFVASVVVLGMVVQPQTATAQQMVLQSGDPVQVRAIQAQCLSIRATISRIQHNDALLRVNVGQAYNTLSSQLMARLNSRLALEKIDSTHLVSIAQRFESERKQFATRYNNYETLLGGLAKSPCNEAPAQYYAQLVKAREARQDVGESVEVLHELIGQYRTAVEGLKGVLGGGGNG